MLTQVGAAAGHGSDFQQSERRALTAGLTKPPRQVGSNRLLPSAAPLDDLVESRRMRGKGRPFARPAPDTVRDATIDGSVGRERRFVRGGSWNETCPEDGHHTGTQFTDKSPVPLRTHPKGHSLPIPCTSNPHDLIITGKRCL